jgi:hypothetical protein
LKGDISKTNSLYKQGNFEYGLGKANASCVKELGQTNNHKLKFLLTNRSKRLKYVRPVSLSLRIVTRKAAVEDIHSDQPTYCYKIVIPIHMHNKESKET